MHRLQSVGVMSVARVMAAIHGIMSLIMVPIFLIAGLAGAFAAPGNAKIPMLLLVVLAFVVPFLYAAMGFVMGALCAVLYNFAAEKLGGIEMHFMAAPLVPGTGLPQAYQSSQFPMQS